MSAITITNIVGIGQYAVPTSDVELALATAGFDALLSTIPDLVYNRVIALVENPEGPDGAIGTRTLRCLVEQFSYDGDENPTPVALNTLATAIEAKLESDAEIISSGMQFFSLFESEELLMWSRSAANGFLYPAVPTDDICVGPAAVPTGKWFQDGDLVLGANAMVGTERLRVAGNTAIEGGAILTEQAATPGGDPGAGKAAFWAKNDTPNRAYFTDDANGEHRLANYFKDANVFYVSKSGSVTGDGSSEAPFLTIQAAVDAVIALVPPSQAWVRPTMVSIGPGVYDENVLIRTDCFLKGSDDEPTAISPSTGVALTITNATVASYNAYRAGGSANYGLLVNDGALPLSGGPQDVVLDGIFLYSPNARALECLGVKGDAAPTTTSFLSTYGLLVGNVSVSGSLAGVPVNSSARLKNCNIVYFYTDVTVSGNILIENCSTFVVYGGGVFGTDIDIDYNAASADGTPSYGKDAIYFFNSNLEDINIINDGNVNLYNCHFDEISVSNTGDIRMDGGFCKGSVVLSDTATINAASVGFRGGFTIGGTATANLYFCSIIGATTIVAGIGVVTERDCQFVGLITDASDKLLHAGEERMGVYTESLGTGTRAVAFTPNFPNGSTIIVSLMFEDTGSGYQTGMIASGTLAHTGFSLTTGGNGKFHWRAHKVK